MLPNELRPDGVKHTLNRHRPMTIWDAIHSLMTTRKSMLMPASVPGPDSWRKSTRAARPDRSVCMSEMRLKDGVIAVIEDPEEIKRILRHLVKINRGPPGLDTNLLN